jgi:hypothetical protein
MGSQHEAEPRLIASAIQNDPVVEPLLGALTSDADFSAAWQSLDVPRFVSRLSDATTHLNAYVAYHQREQRLWAIKIGKGSLEPGLEDGLKQSVPAARDHFTRGFDSVDQCLATVEGSAFKAICDTHVARLSARCAFDDGNVFGRTASTYYQRLGFSTAQIEEFKRQYAPIGYDFIGTVGKGDVSQIRAYSAAGRDAHVQIMNHTEQHGLDYIRGRGGPPAWAVTASGILALFGISISAWVIVAIIAAIAVTLAFLCWAFWSSLPGWAQAGCVALASAGLISFTF